MRGSEKVKGNKTLLICIIASLILLMSAGAAAAAEINVPGDYTTIQAAVDAASAGDTIIVEPGTYTENVDVDEEVKIIANSTNPEDTVVQAADIYQSIFNVTADNVEIRGFTIKDTGYGSWIGGSAGVYLDEVNNCLIHNNIISNCDNGIVLWNSHENTLKNNAIDSMYWDAIDLFDSDQNLITENEISDNGWGIWLDWWYSDGSDNNVIKENLINSNDCDGIYLGESDQNMITNNIVKDTGDFSGLTTSVSAKEKDIKNLEILEKRNLGHEKISAGDEAIEEMCGIVLWLSSDNEISQNMVQENSDDGIYLEESDNNKILQNFVNSNEVNGIYLYKSDDNEIIQNVANSHEDSGIKLEESCDNDVLRNMASLNDYGISLVENSENNDVIGNILFGNSVQGLFVENPGDNNLQNNLG